MRQRLEPARVLSVLADQRHGGEIDVEQREARLEQRPGDGVLVSRAGERARQRRDLGQLPVEARNRLLRLARRFRRRLLGPTTSSKEHQPRSRGSLGPWMIGLD